MAVSAIDSATTYAAMRGGAQEKNPLYQSDDALTVAVSSFVVSLGMTWVLSRTIKKAHPKKRKLLWDSVTALRGFGIPFNVNAMLHEGEDE